MINIHLAKLVIHGQVEMGPINFDLRVWLLQLQAGQKYLHDTVIHERNLITISFSSLTAHVKCSTYLAHMRRMLMVSYCDHSLYDNSHFLNFQLFTLVDLNCNVLSALQLSTEETRNSNTIRQYYMGDIWETIGDLSRWQVLSDFP